MNFLLPIEVRSFYTQKKKYRVHLLDTNGILKGSLLPSAGDRTRTGTISRRILSFLIHSELSSLSRNLTVSFADKNLLKTAETPRKPGFLG